MALGEADTDARRSEVLAFFGWGVPRGATATPAGVPALPVA
jgi:hypothetical protein